MNFVGVGILGSVVVTFSGMFFQAPTPATSATDGIKELIDNQRVTICEVTLTKGHKWPMEQYDEDTLVVPLTPVSLKITSVDGKATTVSLKPGEVRFWPKGTHQAAEHGNDGRAIVAHFKEFTAPPYTNTSGYGPAFPRPRVKKLFENDPIVVWDYTWVQGEPTPNHFHDKDLMIVYLADGAIRSVTPDGKATPNEFKFAEVRFNPGNRAHYEEYVRGDGPRAIVTELKQTASSQSRPSAAPEAPKFNVDPAWPKIPSKWQFGQVASVSVGADDHVWILQRPSTLEAHETGQAAPPVLEFDAAGNFIKAWGGPGSGYEWPASEHGIFVDHRGFVWIGGNGAKDHQILKFTKEGTFVMQIGKAGQSKGNSDTQNLNQPADTFVYAKTNELFVADGYGNRRIIVFDADTGKFKRMWGAFGNRPTDDPPNPAPADADERGASQFVQPIHAARVSSDGMVYVSDRGGKRVQVFTTEGKYLSQVFIGRECLAPKCGNGTTAASTAFSTDPKQRFLYVGNRSQAKVMVLDRASLRVLDSFGQWGSKPGEFGTLHHMASDSKGNLYVTEVTPLAPQNRRVQKFVLAAR